MVQAERDTPHYVEKMVYLPRTYQINHFVLGGKQRPMSDTKSPNCRVSETASVPEGVRDWVRACKRRGTPAEGCGTEAGLNERMRSKHGFSVAAASSRYVDNHAHDLLEFLLERVCTQARSRQRGRPWRLSMLQLSRKVDELRRKEGLPGSDRVVFMNLNKVTKIGPGTVDLLAGLLRVTPGSVAWLLSSKQLGYEASIRLEFAARGISPHRIVIAQRQSKQEHAARLGLADVFVDSVDGYGAHSTAADALAAGVPLVTYNGGSFPERVGCSILKSYFRLKRFRRHEEPRALPLVGCTAGLREMHAVAARLVRGRRPPPPGQSPGLGVAPTAAPLRAIASVPLAMHLRAVSLVTLSEQLGLVAPASGVPAAAERTLGYLGHLCASRCDITTKSSADGSFIMASSPGPNEVDSRAGMLQWTPRSGDLERAYRAMWELHQLSDEPGGKEQGRSVKRMHIVLGLSA